MTICPIAIAVGCKKCPAFQFCPLTTVLGDQVVGAWEEDLPTADKHLDKEDDLEKKKPLIKDERLALIKKSEEKKSAHDNESW